jgi:hypothetical protein
VFTEFIRGIRTRNSSSDSVLPDELAMHDINPFRVAIQTKGVTIVITDGATHKKVPAPIVANVPRRFAGPDVFGHSRSYSSLNDIPVVSEMQMPNSSFFAFASCDGIDLQMSLVTDQQSLHDFQR